MIWYAGPAYHAQGGMLDLMYPLYAGMGWPLTHLAWGW